MFWFNKKITSKKLKKNANKVHRKEWDKRLNSIVKTAKEAALQGKTTLVMSIEAIKCIYTISRPRDLIIKDIQKRIKKCNVKFDSTFDGRETIILNWE